MVRAKSFITLLGICIILFQCSCNDKHPVNRSEEIPVSDSNMDDLPPFSGNRPFDTLSVQGIYSGTLPMANAAGVIITLELRPDKTYSLTRQIIGRGKASELRDNGTFELDSSTQIITLSGIQDEPNQYQLGMNTLTRLDSNGQVITGSLADKYVLKK